MPNTGSTGVSSLLREISGIGRDRARGGYSRFTYTGDDLELREWFTAQARQRSLDVETDRNGGLWAWRPGRAGSLADAVVTGSHLDSVPGGGAFDGPLGVASAFAAHDLLGQRGLLGTGRPLAIALFPEEEGARFGVACLASRLLTGAISPDRARGLTDADGVSYAEAARRAGLSPDHLGRDDERLARIGAFVELHVEQGRGLVDSGAAVGLGTSIFGHGRWRVTVEGEGNHAGTTLMSDRRDPVVAASAVVLAVRELARATDGARATVGRLTPVPGGTNVIASRVDLWLDVRHADDQVTAGLIERITAAAGQLAAGEGCTASVTEESVSPGVSFDPGLTAGLARALGGVPALPTGAGHDAGILAPHVPATMLFVRNPTGISHAPAEYAEPADCEAGAQALADALGELLAGRIRPARALPLRPPPGQDGDRVWRATGSGQDALPPRLDYRLKTGPGAQAGHGRPQVALHRQLRQPEAGGDALVGQPQRDQGQHVDLARRQPPVAAGRGRPADDLAQLAGGLRVGRAGGHLAQPGEHLDQPGRGQPGLVHGLARPDQRDPLVDQVTDQQLVRHRGRLVPQQFQVAGPAQLGAVARVEQPGDPVADDDRGDREAGDPLPQDLGVEVVGDVGRPGVVGNRLGLARGPAAAAEAAVGPDHDRGQPGGRGPAGGGHPDAVLVAQPAEDDRHPLGAQVPARPAEQLEVVGPRGVDGHEYLLWNLEPCPPACDNFRTTRSERR